MKHVFIINPAAGKEDSLEALKTLLSERADCEVYATTGPGDATEYIRRRCTENPDERVRFYACGGDGTLNEVANGVYGFENASMGCYPCGSGNDFVKYFGGKKVFRNIDALLEAPEEYIDLMRVDGRYAINATHFGFDSSVATVMKNVRRKKIIGGSNAYTTGVVVSLFKAMKNKCIVRADGELLNPEGEILLCTIANGQYVGGSFRCAPRSLCNDGLLEVCVVRPVSLVTFMNLIKFYSEGLHLESPKFEKYLTYKRAKTVEIEAPEGFIYSFDGELISSSHFTVEAVPGAVRFAVPRGAIFLPGALHVSRYAEEKELSEV